MKTVNIHEAKTHLSRLVEGATKGEPFVIARAGHPLVKVVAIEGAGNRPGRLGFLQGQFAIPEDFDRLGEAEIARRFGAGTR